LPAKAASLALQFLRLYVPIDPTACPVDFSAYIPLLCLEAPDSQDAYHRFLLQDHMRWCPP